MEFLTDTKYTRIRSLNPVVVGGSSSRRGTGEWITEDRYDYVWLFAQSRRDGRVQYGYEPFEPNFGESGHHMRFFTEDQLPAALKAATEMFGQIETQTFILTEVKS